VRVVIWSIFFRTFNLISLRNPMGPFILEELEFT
jgi:hypothetical protein